MFSSTHRPTDSRDNALTTNSRSEALQVTYAESFPLLVFSGKYALIFCSLLLQVLEGRLSRCLVMAKPSQETHTPRGCLRFAIKVVVFFNPVGGNWSTLKTNVHRGERADPACTADPADGSIAR